MLSVGDLSTHNMPSHENTTKALLYELINSEVYNNAPMTDQADMLYSLFEKQFPAYETERTIQREIKTVTPEMILLKKVLDAIKKQEYEKENPHN